jgi:regulator of protease activity HflC (stomatin/prohibitin superfamily)
VSGASDITAEAADVVYLPRSLDKLPKLMEVSRRAMHTAWQNIFLFAGVLNAAAVILCATGKIGPIGAAFTHQISSFLVMMNSLRLLRIERGRRTILGRWIRATPIPTVWERLRTVHPASGFQWIWSRRRELQRPALIAIAVLVLLNGFYVLQPDELGIVERFGKKVLPYSEPGLHYKLPWPVERLTRIQASRVRVIEVGFRSSSSAPGAEPAAYEWNVQHRAGRFQKKPEESLMLSGDQNMIEVNATVHYNLVRPDDFLFRQLDGDITVRAAAESVIQSIATSTLLDEILTSGRAAIEQKAIRDLQGRMDRYMSGIRILRVKLQDVHPSLEVVLANGLALLGMEAPQEM